HRAIEEAEKELPDVVIMDIMLEGYMSGIEAAEKISNGLNIPVIFLTALNDDETFLSAAETKPYGFISKPFKHEQIEEALSSALKE
ncbi:MAG: response regulator, partial [Ignavibacteriales bacterium]